MIKSITMSELTQLQKDYESAVEKKQEWIIQAMDIVFDKIDLGKILIDTRVK
tara:strand:+ start:118 stop:273 length:156 start_codon:yes stop_codon:yes gene_type:complete